MRRLNPTTGCGLSERRRGAAMVEAAICLPVLLLLIFGSMEVTDAIFLKHSLKSASYEAARVVTATNGKWQDGNSLATQILDNYRVTGYSIDINPQVNKNSAQGTVVTVTVRAPIRTNRLFVSNLAGQANREVVATTVMTRQ